MSISVPLTEACADPDLLDLGLWPMQARMARALDDGIGMVVAALGRRGGKTALAAAALVHDALLRPECDALVRPGETRYAVVVATKLAQAQAVVSVARSMVEASPVLAPYLVDSTADELTFERPGGARTAILALPCSSRGGRGLATSLLVLDELGHFLSDTDGPATADRVWAALTPGTAQFGDLARVIVISTPLGDDNLFARLHRDAVAGVLPNAVALQASTLEANPTISPGFVEAQRRVVSAAEFAAEYEASFAAVSGGFLDVGQIRLRTPEPAEPADLVDQCVVGLDPGQRDGFGLVVVGAAMDQPARLRVVLARKLDARSFTGAVDEAARVARRFRARVVTDQHAGAMVAERLRAAGVGVMVRPWAQSSGPVATGKWEAYADVRTRLYDGTLEVLDDPELLGELGGLQLKAVNGVWRVHSPRRAGSHGDLASALALAVAHCSPVPERLAWLSAEERDRLAVEEVRSRQRRAAAYRERWGEDPPKDGGSLMGDILTRPL